MYHLLRHEQICIIDKVKAKNNTIKETKYELSECTNRWLQRRMTNQHEENGRQTFKICISLRSKVVQRYMHVCASNLHRSFREYICSSSWLYTTLLHSHLSFFFFFCHFKIQFVRDRPFKEKCFPALKQKYHTKFHAHKIVVHYFILLEHIFKLS
jgi:hypothetical protein